MDESGRDAASSRWCLVTGASAGIGREVATGLLRDGFCVAGVARGEARLADLAAEWPGRFIAIRHDVAVPGLIPRLAELGVPFDKLELVVHSAGCARQGVPLTEMDEADLRDVVATNVLGSTYVVRDMARVLLQRGAGSLVVLGSVASQDAAPLMAVYAASKAYLKQLVRCARSDLHGSGVRIACVQPGTTRTGLLDDVPGLSSQERFLGFSPLETSDIAHAIRWIHQQPPHVNVQEITVFPVAQSMFVRGVHRHADARQVQSAG